MRRLLSIVGMLVVSCLLAGCGDGGSGEATATPENLDAARAAANRMKDMDAAYAKSKAASKGAPASGAAPKPAAPEK